MSQLSQSSISEVEFEQCEHLDQYFSLSFSPCKL